MRITIHQPEHMPWLGLIDKISKVDLFVILDNVQFKKNDFQNRNKIRSSKKQGFSWITVPVKNHPLSANIKDIQISYSHNWIEQYINLIKENYKGSEFFEKYFEMISNILNKRFTGLSELNIEIIKLILNEFKVKTKIVYASDLGLSKIKGGNEVVLDICKKVNASTYLSGIGGKSYLNLKDFERENIKVEFQEFKHPTYQQQFEPFMPFMSCIDLLFNAGPMSGKILFNQNKLCEF